MVTLSFSLSKLDVSLQMETQDDEYLCQCRGKPHNDNKVHKFNLKLSDATV